jgi:molecular chaperone GrpE
MFNRKKTDKDTDTDVPVEINSKAEESEASAAKDAPGEAAAEPQAEDKGAEETTEDWHDRYLRLVAEFDNFRKRSAREFGNVVATAERDLIAQLTEVLDNLERAVSADHKGESVDEFAKGVALIRDQLWDVLGRRGLTKMETVGNAFDPEAHDALMRAPSEEHDEGIIVQEVSPGYRLNDKILRHAKVIVSQGSPDSDEGDTKKRDDEGGTS